VVSRTEQFQLAAADASMRLEQLQRELPQLLDILAIPVPDNLFDPALHALMLSRWTGTAHGPEEGCDVPDEGTCRELWPLLTRMFPLTLVDTGNMVGQTQGRLYQNLLGARADLMAAHLRLMESGKPITVLAGMRPVDAIDRAWANRHRVEITSETDAAREIVRQRGACLTGSVAVPTIAGVENELGERRVTEYHYSDGSIVLNGIPVRRGSADKPAPARHTSVSVMQEWLLRMRGRLGEDDLIQLFVTYPHGGRITDELRRMLFMQQDAQAWLESVQGLPTPDRLRTPATLLGEVAPSMRAAHDLVRFVCAQTAATIVDLAVPVIGTIPQKQREIAVLLKVAPPTRWSRTAGEGEVTLSQYMEGILGRPGLRRCDMQPAFGLEGIAPLQEALHTLGIPEFMVQSDRQLFPDKQLHGKGFAYLIEGGTVLKMSKVFALLEDRQPSVIFISGAAYRQIPGISDQHEERLTAARILGINPEDVGDTEYEAALNFAQRKLVSGFGMPTIATAFRYVIADKAVVQCPPEDADFTLLGATVKGVPVLVIRVRRTEPDHDGNFENPGVSGLLQIVDRFLDLQPDLHGVEAICLGAGVLYKPTRDEQIKIANQNTKRTAYGAYYASANQCPAQIASEAYHLLKLLNHTP